MRVLLKYYFCFLAIALTQNINDGGIYDRSWALIIGINDYENVPDLHYAVEDALAVKNMLINNFNFSRNDVRVLIDKEATQSNINKEMSKLLKSAGENDRVVFYFAGHGETEELGLEEGDAGFLMPSDADVENLYFSAIPMEDLRSISKFSKAKHMLFLVDACYSGLAAVNTRGLSKNTPDYLDKITRENARQIITAGQKDEKVLEKDEWEHSAFTKNLISGLKDKKANSNGDDFITGSELGFYLQEKVSLDTENSQTPQVKRLTTHEGEMIFLSKSEKTKQKTDYELDLKKLILELEQLKVNQEVVKKNVRVIKPGSTGLYARNPSQEVMIVRIFYRPSGLAYEAKFKLNINASDEMSWSKVSLIEIDDVLEIKGETITGIYNYDTGTVE
ncbi:MAG: caspase family protein [Candidatus Marinimicrobia bacterium]|nr:caspase family protein [Candidatus Neomarinimicrobiota bacterium]